MKIIREHEKLPRLSSFDPEVRSLDYPDGMLLNPHADPYDQKYFFVWNRDGDGKPCYMATYIIGAQRIGKDELIIEPKMNNIDFMKMFSVCLSSNLAPEYFSKIYNIDMDAEPIKTNTAVTASLTPLLIVHFVKLISQIVSKGLRSDYIEKNENLKKVKGRIDISNNERKNVIFKRFDRVFCNYSERSVDIPENRLFKKALKYCKQYVSLMSTHELYSKLLYRINNCLSAFGNVSDQFEIQEMTYSKRNKLYKDYDSSIKLAKMILKRFDYSLTKIEIDEQVTPVFWIDMSLLYEHYVYGLLHKAYGSQVIYQVTGMFNWKPDFLHLNERIIMDAKYMDKLDEGRFSGDIVRQLGGYARVKSFSKRLYVDDETVIPCLIFYPTESVKAEPFVFDSNNKLIEQAEPVAGLTKFYKFGIPLPQQSMSE